MQDTTNEAIDWMIALQEAPENPELLAAFDRWLAASPANARAWRDVERTCFAVRAVSGELTERDGVDPVAGTKEHREILPVEDSAHSFRRKVRPLALAAGATLAILVFLFLPKLQLLMEADHLTNTGETRLIKLADGSKVHLGAESAIAVDFEVGRRQIRLLGGQAFFDVAPDAANPFSVRVNDVETTVLGTAFEVRETSEGAAVAVTHGAVKVNLHADGGGTGEEGAQLTEGQQLELSQQDISQIKAIDPNRVAMWRQGRLVAENWLIADVLNALSRHYHGRILVAEPGVQSKRVSGVYDLTEPLDAIRLVAATQELHVHQVSPWLLVIAAF